MVSTQLGSGQGVVMVLVISANLSEILSRPNAVYHISTRPVGVWTASAFGKKPGPCFI